EMAMNQSCYGLRGVHEDTYFTYFSTKRLVDNLKQRAHGSVFDTITQETFKGVMVVMPPLAVVNAFENFLFAFMDRLLSNLISAETLADLRDTLLPRLISGQLRIPEAQEQIESALS